ncbi:hypothetical protein LEJ14_22505, partial [Salmonella enterica]|nr:hypothetical protein [Salmonella enterica]
MSVLLTEPTQQANDKVFKTAHVAFSVVTGTGRYVTGLKQFRDANPELCTEVSDQKAWAIHPSVIQVTPGFNSRCQQRVKSDPLTATTNGLILI